ncbi:MAG: DUF1801 domain-containing protein [Anaerolineales bacterium]|jgi:uncharacterized protein YdhG (YjbR/CyaY superfamily)|nr:DUF1801 domain-containing protein [Chloroflexota bacterium]MBK6644953.1 DUF1801 domain-containing protein [Anaerolineales bacterium]
MAKTNFQSIDEYIFACPPGSQAYLRQIRKLIHTLVPDAKEKISYQMAAFERNGRNLIHFAGWKKHISLYPVPAGSEAFERQIKPYVSDKGTVKFPLDEPLPLKLIEKIVKQHLAVNEKQKKEN